MATTGFRIEYGMTGRGTKEGLMSGEGMREGDFMPTLLPWLLDSVSQYGMTGRGTKEGLMSGEGMREGDSMPTLLPWLLDSVSSTE